MTERARRVARRVLRRPASAAAVALAFAGCTPPARQPEVPVAAKALDPAQRLVEDALAAKGGKGKLASLRALKLTAAGTTMIQGQSVLVELSRVVVLPDKMRIDATIKPPRLPRDIVVSVGVSGQTGWQRGPDPRTNAYRVEDITGDALTTLNFERWRDPELILLKAAEPTAKLTPAPDETIDGKPCAVVRLRSPFGDLEVSLYIDKQTKLVGRMSYPNGGGVENDDFADYRDVGGLKVAYKRTTTSVDRTSVLELKAVELDPAIDPAVFTKPAAP